VALAVAAFFAIFAAGIDFPWIVVAAGAIGWLAGRSGVSVFTSTSHGAEATNGETPRLGMGGETRRLLRLVAVFIALWVVPVVLVVGLFGAKPFAEIAELFTKAAFVTFGGAYAVLPYIAEEAVRTYAWLSPDEMLNGLALAETTPGPLILVLQYVGFFAGWHNPAALSPAAAGTVAALLTTYVTFLPSFLFILAGAPYIAGLHENKAIGSGLGAITAAVVGVILNLGVFLAQGVFFPAVGGIDIFAIAASLAALLVLIRFNLAIHWLVAAGAALGFLHWFAISLG
jgi:chromate transporter